MNSLRIIPSGRRADLKKGAIPVFGLERKMSLCRAMWRLKRRTGHPLTPSIKKHWQWGGETMARRGIAKNIGRGITRRLRMTGMATMWKQSGTITMQNNLNCKKATTHREAVKIGNY